MNIKPKSSIISWLYISVFLIFIIVTVGGITRLTDSGLSMVDWKPIMGSIPPLTADQWQTTFDAYKTFPEYQKVNVNMTLSEFKSIFFWEYLHRMLGRLIGLCIIFPYFYFLIKKQLSKPLIFRGAIMIILILAQGVMGWYMVKSGLVDNPGVSHFRLAAHLLLAFFLLQYILWTLYSILWRKPTQEKTYYPIIYGVSWGITGLVFFQIMVGAFVSGLDAGYGYNTFPKMGTEWFPEAGLMLDSLWKNLLYNPVMIQFIHRTLAWMVVGAVLLFCIYSAQFSLTTFQKRARLFLLCSLGLQFLLGVLTLIYVIPLPIALAHQFGGLLLLSSSVLLSFSLSRSL